VDSIYLLNDAGTLPDLCESHHMLCLVKISNPSDSGDNLSYSGTGMVEGSPSAMNPGVGAYGVFPGAEAFHACENSEFSFSLSLYLFSRVSSRQQLGLW
jgi:hypothetical protein